MFDHSQIAADFPAIKQRTLKSSIGCKGIGLHSGASIKMTLHPAVPDTGIVFRRTDLTGSPLVPAVWSNVTDTRLNTCIGDAREGGIHTIEHLMSALAGMGIDNAVIDVSGAEVPVMDGSAAPFLFMIECAGVVEQDAPRRFLKLLKPVVVERDGVCAAIVPAPSFSIHFTIDFANAAIGRQEYDFALEDGGFKNEISRARTFGFEHEIQQMRAAGLGRGGSLDNAVVISGNKVLNEEGLRYKDEFVRHKILDAVGDLYLAGCPIIGHFHAVRSGHAMNNQLLRAIFADPTAWTYTVSPAEGRHRSQVRQYAKAS